MKILYINNYHYPRGGADRIYLETADLLKARGHEVIYFSVKDHNSIPLHQNEYFVRPVNFFSKRISENLINSFKFIYSIEAKKKLELIIKKEKPDLAHLHIFYGRLTLSILPILKKYNIKTVMTIHDYKLICPTYRLLDNECNLCEKCASGSYIYCILKKCNKGNLSYSVVAALETFIRDLFFPYEEYIDKFIMVSKFVLEKHVEYKPSLKNKAVNIYNFTEIWGNNNKIYGSHDYYLSFGRLSREKGLLTLLKAWRKFPRLKLKIAGEGEYRNEICQFIKENHLTDVEMLGLLNGDDLIRQIQGAKFIVVPSEWYEPFGLTIIESFAHGTPVIGAKIGGIAELIKDKYNGILFESNNVVSLAAAIRAAESISQENYYQMSKKAFESVNNQFNKEIYYNNLIEVYNDLVEASR
jgi:glycosyltransferase involved in cell wall biosynthesis